MIEPSHRKQLNQEQIRVLRTLYTFRFGTAEFFAKNHGSVSQRYMNERLRILCEQEYIGRKYDGSFRLYGKPAAYYLLDKGVDFLKQFPDQYERKTLTNIKRMKIKNSAIWHYINIFKTYLRLRELYGNDIKFYTKSNLLKFSYFPKNLPDAYLVFNDGGETRRAMITYFDWSQSMLSMKKYVNELATHAESDAWPVGAPYPELWIICETTELYPKVRKWITTALEKSWDDNAVFHTTTRQTLFDPEHSASDRIWEICRPSDNV